MEATLRKVGALCAKDFPDLIKNPMMIVSIILPILFVLFFQNLYGDMQGGSPEETEAVNTMLDNFILWAGVCMAAGSIPGMIVLYSMAEEREKHTLRTLMLANVSGGQVLASKTIVTLIATLVVDAVIFFIVGWPVEYLLSYLVIVLVGTLPIVLLSLVLGVSARDQMSAGLYSFPIIIIAFLPLFGWFNEDLDRIMQYSPCGGMVNLLDLIPQGLLFSSEAIFPFVVTLAWIAITVVLYLLFYKRLGRDN